MEKGLIYRSTALLLLLAALSGVTLGRSAAAEETDPFVLINMGLGLSDLGMYNESLAAYELAIKISPNNSDAWVGKGKVLFTMGKYNESIEDYSRAIGLSKRNADAWYGKGNTLVRLGRNKEAIDCYDETLALRPGYVEAYENRELARNARSSMSLIKLPYFTVHIVTDPPGADVFDEQGKLIGNTGNPLPFEKSYNMVEAHTLEVRKNGISRKINFTSDKYVDIYKNLVTNETSMTYPYG
jgi:tetratricopeptide (TPR) repeat protein